MVLANTDPDFAIKQITPEVISSQPADETTETGPPTVNLPFWACTLPLSSPGENPEQAAPLSGSPTKNRDSTLPLASSNNSMNGQDTQKLQKVNKQRQRQAGAERQKKQLSLVLAYLQKLRHNMGLGSIVWRGWLVINELLNTQKNPLLST